MSRTSTRVRFSYAASDIAGQFVFCWVMWYAPYFYTDTCKISAATVTDKQDIGRRGGCCVGVVRQWAGRRLCPSAREAGPSGFRWSR